MLIRSSRYWLSVARTSGVLAIICWAFNADDSTRTFSHVFVISLVFAIGLRIKREFRKMEPVLTRDNHETLD